MASNRFADASSKISDGLKAFDRRAAPVTSKFVDVTERIADASSEIPEKDATSTEIDTIASSLLRSSAEHDRTLARESYKKSGISDFKRATRTTKKLERSSYRTVIKDARAKFKSGKINRIEFDKTVVNAKEKFKKSVSDANKNLKKQSSFRYGTKDLSKKEISMKKKGDYKNLLDSKKYRRKAAAKTSTANVIEASKEVKNSLTNTSVSGNALSDGNTGLTKIIVKYINPVTYLKMLLQKVIAIIAPSMLSFFLHAIPYYLLIVIVSAPVLSISNKLSYNNMVKNITVISNKNAILPPNVVKHKKLSDGEINSVIAVSGADSTTSAVIKYALERVGCEYSQSKAPRSIKDNGYYDCSSLAFKSWYTAGFKGFGNLAPTAAEEARHLANYEVKDGLKAGDLIFYYRKKSTNRYKNIGHVSIYVGNGHVVSASSPSRGVVYEPIDSRDIVFIGRPSI